MILHNDVSSWQDSLRPIILKLQSLHAYQNHQPVREAILRVPLSLNATISVIPAGFLEHEWLLPLPWCPFLCKEQEMCLTTSSISGLSILSHRRLEHEQDMGSGKC